MAARNTPSVPSVDERPAVDAKAYNKVVQIAELVAVQVTKVRLDVQPEYFEDVNKNSLLFDRYERGAQYNAEKGAVLGRFEFTVSARRGRRKVLTALAEYVVIYDLPSAVEADAAEAFCNRVGMFAAYPYFRALTAHLAWESNSRLPPLPVIATRGSMINVARPKAARRKATKPPN